MHKKYGLEEFNSPWTRTQVRNKRFENIRVFVDGTEDIFDLNLTFAFTGNFDLSIIMPNFTRVNQDEIQHLNHFIRNDCIPLRDWPKEGSWRCVPCVHDKLELTEASCARQGQPCRWCSIVDHSCKCPRPRYLPIQTGPPFDKRQNNIHWCLVFKGKGDETRATGNTRRNGKAPPSPGRFPGKHKEGSSHNPGFHDNFSQKRLRGRGRE